jgi:hypothetical protein
VFSTRSRRVALAAGSLLAFAAATAQADDQSGICPVWTAGGAPVTQQSVLAFRNDWKRRHPRARDVTAQLIVSDGSPDAFVFITYVDQHSRTRGERVPVVNECWIDNHGLGGPGPWPGPPNIR